MSGSRTIDRLRREYIIPSKVKHIYPVEQQILALARELGFSDDDCFCLRLSMDEAMVNAIIHGNKYDASKQVYVKVDGGDAAFEVTVRDEGDGYSVDDLQDPTTEENLHATHGRGIFLIRQFMSQVLFNDIGNQITFIIRRNDEVNRFPSRE